MARRNAQQAWMQRRPVRRVEAKAERGRFASSPWPFAVPAVRRLLTDGLDLSQATILVGENGSGKSTVLEAIAEAYGLNAEGGSTGAQHTTRRSESSLAEALTLVRDADASRGGYFLRAETMHGFYTYLEEVGMASFHERSHGESFLDLMEDRFFDRQGRPRPGLYLFDELESALSFSSSLRVLAMVREMLETTGVQIILATHSPVLAALPGATILQFDDTGCREAEWADLDLVVTERAFLANPHSFLRHLDP